jgi:hypothetical protein
VNCRHPDAATAVNGHPVAGLDIDAFAHAVKRRRKPTAQSCNLFRGNLFWHFNEILVGVPN